MLFFIALFFLIASFLGMFFVVARKIPVLKSATIQSPAKNEIFPFLKEKIKNIEFLQFLSVENLEKLLLKTLSKIRILTLKVESRVGEWIASLRRKSIEEKKDKFSKNYWENLKK